MAQGRTPVDLVSAHLLLEDFAKRWISVPHEVAYCSLAQEILQTLGQAPGESTAYYHERIRPTIEGLLEKYDRIFTWPLACSLVGLSSFTPMPVADIPVVAEELVERPVSVESVTIDLGAPNNPFPECNDGAAAFAKRDKRGSLPSAAELKVGQKKPEISTNPMNKRLPVGSEELKAESAPVASNLFRNTQADGVVSIPKGKGRGSAPSAAALKPGPQSVSATEVRTNPMNVAPPDVVSSSLTQAGSGEISSQVNSQPLKDTRTPRTSFAAMQSRGSLLGTERVEVLNPADRRKRSVRASFASRVSDLATGAQEVFNPAAIVMDQQQAVNGSNVVILPGAEQSVYDTAHVPAPVPGPSVRSITSASSGGSFRTARSSLHLVSPGRHFAGTVDVPPSIPEGGEVGEAGISTAGPTLACKSPVDATLSGAVDTKRLVPPPPPRPESSVPFARAASNPSLVTDNPMLDAGVKQLLASRLSSRQIAVPTAEGATSPSSGMPPSVNSLRQAARSSLVKKDNSFREPSGTKG